jgi:hypothetical protein
LTYRSQYRNLDIDPRGFFLFENVWITPVNMMSGMNIEINRESHETRDPRKIGSP